MRHARPISDLCGWQVESGEEEGQLKLRLCRALRIFVNDEEPNDFPTVQAGGPLFIWPYVTGAGNTECAQAVVTTNDVVPVPIPSCLDWFAVNVWAGNSQRWFSGQVGDGSQQRLKSESILVEISVGSHSFRQIIGGGPADNDNGYLRKALAYDVEKLQP